MVEHSNPDTSDPLFVEAQEALGRLVGTRHATFRSGQYEAVSTLVLDKARTLVVERTGWGKSAVYFVATELLRARGRGPTLIVSPLLALMRDQIAAARRAGIRAAAINSANPEDWQEIFASIRNNTIDVLLVSPERLNNPVFREQYLPNLSANLGLLVVDEAHCISDWGHDFRPDYRRIRDLLTQLPGGTPVLATTATANARVVADVFDQLSVTADGPTEVRVIRGPLARESLSLGVLQLPEASDRAAWLLDHLASFDGSGIIYTLTVSAAEDLAKLLTDAGHLVHTYTSKVSADERPGLEEDLKENRLKALIATSALGMGFDKPDLGFVVHLGAPSSPIAYYQQIGRAGRATEKADVLLLPGPEDSAIWSYFASVAMPREDDVRQVLEALSRSENTMSLAALETVVNVKRTRLDLLLKVLDVDGAVRRVRGGWAATGQPWSYDQERYDRVAQSRLEEQASMTNYLSTTTCRMEFLQRVLDDPSAAACGKCDRCATPWYDTTFSSTSALHAKDRLRQSTVVIEPRSLWPSGMAKLGVQVSGRISQDIKLEPGRCLARFSDLGRGQQLRKLLDEPDEALPAEILEAVIAMLRDWNWETRPTAIAAIPSRRHPRLIDSLRTSVAQRGRLADLGTLDFRHNGPQGEPGGNSAFRLAGVWNAFSLEKEPDSELPNQGPVLLVDDLIDSRWTMTVAGMVLRLEGFSQVLPMALAAAG